MGNIDRFLSRLTPFCLQEDQNQDPKKQQNKGQILHSKDVCEQLLPASNVVNNQQSPKSKVAIIQKNKDIC